MDAVRVTRSGRTYKTPRTLKLQCADGKSPEQNCRKRLDRLWDTNNFDDLLIEEIKKQLSPNKTAKVILKPLSPVKTPKKSNSVLPSIASPLRCLSLNSPNKGVNRNKLSHSAVLSPKKSCLMSVENICTTPKKDQFSPSKVQKTSPKRYINYPLATSPSKRRREETAITVTPIKSRGFYSPTKMNPVRSPLKQVPCPSLNSRNISVNNKPKSTLSSVNNRLDTPQSCNKDGVVPPNNTPNLPNTNQISPSKSVFKTPSSNQAEKQGTYTN